MSSKLFFSEKAIKIPPNLMDYPDSSQHLMLVGELHIVPSGDHLPPYRQPMADPLCRKLRFVYKKLLN